MRYPTVESGLYPSYYAWLSWRARQHHSRYRRRVETTADSLPCQDCGGLGGETVPVLDDGSGPFEECPWCEGTGCVTRWMRGYWLAWRRRIKGGFTRGRVQ